MMCAEITSWTRTVLEPGAAVAEGWLTVCFGYNQNTQWDVCGKFTIFLLQYKTKGLKATHVEQKMLFSINMFDMMQASLIHFHKKGTVYERAVLC